MILDQLVTTPIHGKPSPLYAAGLHPVQMHGQYMRRCYNGTQRMWQSVAMQCAYDILTIKQATAQDTPYTCESSPNSRKVGQMRRCLWTAVDAWEFMFGEEDKDYLAVCCAADINPDSLREHVRRQEWYLGDTFYATNTAGVQNAKINSNAFSRTTSRSSGKGIVNVAWWLERLSPPDHESMRVCGYENAIEELLYYGYMRSVQYRADGTALITRWGSRDTTKGVVRHG